MSDNATNFVFVQPLVGHRTEQFHYAVNNFLTSNRILWKFIPSHAPWFGGAYGRLVALVKNALKKSYSWVLLDYVELATALCHIEDTINGRPLTYISDKLLDPPPPNT